MLLNRNTIFARRDLFCFFHKLQLDILISKLFFNVNDFLNFFYQQFVLQKIRFYCFLLLPYCLDSTYRTSLTVTCWLFYTQHPLLTWFLTKRKHSKKITLQTETKRSPISWTYVSTIILDFIKRTKVST